MNCCFQLKHAERDLDGCQFRQLSVDVQTIGNFERHYEFRNKYYCAFHLPLSAENGTKSAKADWTEKQINDFNAAIVSLIEETRGRACGSDLSGVVFPGEINFCNKVFQKISFLEVVFGGDAWFKGTAFTQDKVPFEGSVFMGDAWFKNSIFEFDASFMRAVFMGFVYFQEARFSRDVYFHTSQFKDWSRFDNTIFCGAAIFNRCSWNMDVTFSSSGDSLTAGQHEKSNFHNVSFAAASFGGEAIFTNRRFLQPAGFAVKKFAKAPNFHGCLIHEGTIFPGRGAFKDVSGDQAALAYTKLKNSMASFKRIDDEAMFYSLELESKRNGEQTPKAIKRAIWLYKITSDYGQSFIRPVVFLAILSVAAFLFFFLANLIWTGGGSPGDSAMRATTRSLEQIFRPFAIWGVTMPSEVSSATWGWQIAIKLVASIQSTLSIGLLALSIFALRWRFKRR